MGYITLIITLIDENDDENDEDQYVRVVWWCCVCGGEWVGGGETLESEKMVVIGAINHVYVCVYVCVCAYVCVLPT